MRHYILSLNNNITEEWKYQAPFYCTNGKRFCYLWVNKKLKQPYISIVDGYRVNHPDLLQENRKRMKVLLVDANKNIPVKKINGILKQVLALYQ